MSMLNFKHGLYGNLFNTDGSNKVAISNGTIYVTTDEKAMYVDLDGKRIRLSQIVNIPTTAEWQQLKPPFSKEAFYYILDANALLKFNGTDWIQINSTAELDALLAGLGFYSVAPQNPKDGDILVNEDGTVSIYDSKVEGTKWVSYGTVGSKLIDLSSRVATLETTVAGHGTDITNLKTRATNIETAAAETRKAVGFLGKMDVTPATGNLGETVLVGDQVYIWLAEEGETPAGWQPISSLGGRVEELKARIEEVALTAGDQTAVDKLQENLTALANKVNNEETGLAATKAIADKAASDLATYVENHKDDYTNTALDTAIADAKKAGTDAAKALDDYKTANNEAMTALGNRVTALETAGYVKADGTVTMSGSLNAGTHKIINVGAPEAEGDAANKKYVDDSVKVAKDQADKGVADAAKAAQAAAAADAKGAQGITNAAAALAEAQKKTTMAEVEAKGYAVAETVNGQFSTLKGSYEGTLADLNTAAGNAQTTATNAANAAAAITEGAKAKTLKELEEQISGISGNIDDLDKTFAKDVDVENAINDVLGYNEGENPTVFDGTIKGAYDAAGTAAETATTAKNDAKTANDAIALIKDGTTIDSFADVESAINNLDNTYATDDALATEKSNILGEYTDGETKKAYTGTVGSVYDKAVQNAANITTVDGRVTALKTQVEGALQAADAMVYKGTISAATDLPATAQKGWTYKVTTDIAKANFSGITVNWATVSESPKDELYVRAGDLFIATGEEDATTGNITSITWDHIPAGYNADYVPTMSTSVSNGVAKIELTSAHAATNEKGDLGSFQVSAAANSAVTVSVAEGNNIAIGMTWGTF